MSAMRREGTVECGCGAHLITSLLVRVPRSLTSVRCPQCGENVLDTLGQQIDSVIAMPWGPGREVEAEYGPLALRKPTS